MTRLANGRNSVEALAGHSPGRRRRKLEPLTIVGAAAFAAWILVALTWPFWVQDPYQTNLLQAYAAPSLEHLFGTDGLGRDVFARVMAGSSTVLTVAPAATVLTMVIGVTLGAIAGYKGGIFDEVAMRVIDFLLAFPGLIIVIIVLALFSSNELTLVLVLAIFLSPLTARVIRGSVHNLRNADFIDAARLRGDGTMRIIMTEILPNIIPTIGVEATVRLSAAIITLASMSFLGLGIVPPTADWGLMISTDAQSVSFAWWAAMFPALALGSLVMAVALIAEGQRRSMDR